MVYYPFSSRKRNIINHIVSWTLLIEILIIGIQGARGVQSHYDESSNVDGLLFAIMGIFIGINVLIMIFLLIETIRLKMQVPKTVQWAIFCGWVIVLLGSWVGGQMISQSAHNVGAVDGGIGLPLVNWSTTVGDLRVAHFFGLHALQIIPILAYVLHRKWPSSITSQWIGLLIFIALYSGWIAFTYYQASQGIPLISVS